MFDKASTIKFKTKEEEAYDVTGVNRSSKKNASLAMMLERESGQLGRCNQLIVIQ